jgi:ferric-dicitrate binding protein FerR (iron transport regulator)
MKKGSENINDGKLPDEIESVITNSHIKWETSKEQIWLMMEERIERKSSDAGTFIIGRSWIRFAVAASVILLIGFSALTGFYNKTIDVPAGEHAEIYLPDKSLVKLNAQSVVSYKPLAWLFTRTVKFEGEAYFIVKKGKQFTVASSLGKTVVLGTEFNVYSRKNEYQVTCITGKVKVLDRLGNDEVVLDHGQQAALTLEGTFLVPSEVNTEQVLSWMNNKISFTSVPLTKVFEEIGRQYGVRLDFQADLDYIYTGTFVKDSSVANVLNLVCRPFDLQFVQKSDNEYVITGNN